MSTDTVPPPALADWLDGEGIAAGEPVTWQRLEQGVSSVMFRVQRGDRRLVLRRPADVAVVRADDGLRREFRLLGALAGSAVPHPAGVRFCDDPAVVGRIFYLMEEVPGSVVAKTTPEPHRGPVTEAVVDALAQLHDFDWRASLADFGKPGGFHERQVGRWTAQLEAEDGRRGAEAQTVGAWLNVNLPGEWSPVLMHGDYHMRNVLVSAQAPFQVNAIVDWETATIGDPLLDLAGFCEVWTGAFTDPGWPTRDAIIDRYVSARGLGDVPDLTYYDVLYNFRLFVILEGVYQRSCRDANRPDDDMVGQRALFNLDRALELMSTS